MPKYLFHSAFFCFLFLSHVVYAMERVAENAPDSVSLNSVMHLFVQNPNTQDSLVFVETSPNMYIPDDMNAVVASEKNEALIYRLAMEKALEEDRIDDLKQVLQEAESFNRNAKFYRAFYGNEQLILRYFIGDFDCLSNVDSVSRMLKQSYPDELQDELNRKLWKHIESGKIEEYLKGVDDESNRAFIYIVMNSLFKNKTMTSKLIEKYRPQLTDKKQLYFLVTRFWEKEEFDAKNYSAFSLGAAVIKSLGGLADKINWSPGMYLGIDFIRNDFLYEWFMDINGVQNKDPDSLQFVDMRWDFNFGYTFLKNDNMFLYGYATAGFGMNSFYVRGKNSNDKSNDDLPFQFYPSLGAGVMMDLFFTDRGRFHNGLRFRTGFRSLFSGDVLKKSGIRLYASIEWTMHEYTKRPVQFDF